MKRPALGPGDAAAGRLAEETGWGGAREAGARGRRRRDASAQKGRGGSDPARPRAAVSVRGPCARPCARAPGLGPRGLRARPAPKARVTSSRPPRQAWELRGRAGDFWGEGAPRPEGRDRGASYPRPRPGTMGDAWPR